jgi:REP-associated tyrosine transposase
MARPLRIEYPDAFYHVTSRGNERKDIFKSRKDREQFILYLQSSVERYGAVIHAYCMMTNHYHLLVETPHGNLSEIMRHINGAYTTYFNVKRKRAGHLFQGRYKAIVVEADEYALELSRYIHLNPVRAGMVSWPQDHEWSSYRCYAGLATEPAWLTSNLVLGSFGTTNPKANYRSFVEDLIGAEYESPLKGVIASTLLGSPEFVSQVSEAHVDQLKSDRSVPAVKKLSSRPTAEKIMATVKDVLGGDSTLTKKISVYLCHRHGGMKLKEIGERFGIGDAAVSVASKRLLAQAEMDAKVREALERIRKLLIVEP